MPAFHPQPIIIFLIESNAYTFPIIWKMVPGKNDPAELSGAVIYA